jgi:hypothetical protein
MPARGPSALPAKPAALTQYRNSSQHAPLSCVYLGLMPISGPAPGSAERLAPPSPCPGVHPHGTREETRRATHHSPREAQRIVDRTARPSKAPVCESEQPKAAVPLTYPEVASDQGRSSGKSSTWPRARPDLRLLHPWASRSRPRPRSTPPRTKAATSAPWPESNPRSSAWIAADYSALATYPLDLLTGIEKRRWKVRSGRQSVARACPAIVQSVVGVGIGRSISVKCSSRIFNCANALGVWSG